MFPSGLPARVGVIVLVMIFQFITVASACPSCKETVAGDNAGLASGLSYSVLGMMSMPFLLVTLVAGIIIRAYRHRRTVIDGDEPI
jgi:hypothetical protein